MKAPPLEYLIAFAMAAGVVLYSVLFFDGAETSYRLWYYTPAALAVGALAADRVRTRWPKRIAGVIDGAVTLLCLSRPLFGWPPASGHALFFVYAWLTASSLGTRIFAVVLGVVTLYAKIWLWHWDTTLWPGLGLGMIAGTLYHLTRRVHTNPSTSA